MTKWQQPVVMTKEHSLLMSGQDLMKTFLPTMDEIPSEFKGEYGDAVKWCDAVNDFFFCGAKEITMTCRNGIKQEDVIRHIRLVISSWEPPHEQKIAGCAWLLSLWVVQMAYDSAIKPDSDATNIRYRRVTINPIDE